MMFHISHDDQAYLNTYETSNLPFTHPPRVNRLILCAESSSYTRSAQREQTPSFDPISKDPRRSYLTASPPSVRQQGSILEVPKPALSPVSPIR